MRKVHLLLVSHTPLLLSGLKNVISFLDARFMINDSHDGKDFSIFLRHQHIDIMIADVTSLGPSGYERIRNLKKQFPRLKIMLLTYSDRDPRSHSLAKLGVESIMNLTSPEHEIAHAVRALLIGDKYYSTSIQHYLKETAFNDTTPPGEFTMLQRQVAYFVSQGNTTKEISALLNKSPKTIENCRCHLLKKTGCKNTSELIDLFHRQNLLESFSEEFTDRGFRRTSLEKQRRLHQ